MRAARPSQQHVLPAKAPRRQTLSGKENLCGNQPSVLLQEKPVGQNELRCYVQGIVQHLRQTHQRNVPLESPLKVQKEITSKMKSILSNWLGEVHLKFNLKQKTLFIAHNVMERFLAQRSLRKRDFQLLGVASLFIASKLEDIYPPELEELCYLCDSAYNKEEILAMES